MDNAIEWLREYFKDGPGWKSANGVVAIADVRQKIDEAAAKFPLQPTVTLEQVLVCVRTLEKRIDNEINAAVAAGVLVDKREWHLRGSVGLLCHMTRDELTALYDAPRARQSVQSAEALMEEWAITTPQPTVTRIEKERLSGALCRLQDERAADFAKWFKIINFGGLTEYQAECPIIIDAALRDLVKRKAQLASARAKLEQIVCTKEPDRGVVLLSSDSPVEYDPITKHNVYKHVNFSPLGDALIELHELLTTPPAQGGERMNVIICHGLFQPENISNGLGNELLPKLHALANNGETVTVIGDRVFGWTEKYPAEALHASDPLVCIGHSYGVTWCNELARQRENVYALMSCDGVQFPFPQKTLRVASSVRRLYYWYQRKSKVLRGSELRWDQAHTELVYKEEVIDGRRHAQMDEYLGFQDMCIQVCKNEI